MGQKMRVDKFLSNMGKGSRSNLRQIFKSGIVEVNGKKIHDASQKVDVDTDVVLFAGERILYIPYIYLMLNKPSGYVSATEDKKLPVVVDLVPDQYKHYEVFPVGRLDIDTEGLLLLTNDGELTHQLLSPKKHVPKLYEAKLKEPLIDGAEKAFEEGIILEDGYKCLPATLHRTGDALVVQLTIYEGKFHQVKRMFEALDNKVLFLKRLKMGGLELDDALELGAIRALTEDDLKKLTSESI